MKTVITGNSNDVDLPYQVDISNCTVQPCPFLRGSDVTLKLNFVAREYI